MSKKEKIKKINKKYRKMQKAYKKITMGHRN